MSLFKEVEGEAAVLVEGGIYKQVPLFTRNGYLYAKVFGGFVRLMADGSTTKAKLRLETITWSDALYRDALGRLRVDERNGATIMEGRPKQLLLGEDL